MAWIETGAHGNKYSAIPKVFDPFDFAQGRLEPATRTRDRWGKGVACDKCFILLQRS